MNTFFLSDDNDTYEIGYIGLSIFVTKRNRQLIKFSDCPNDIKEQIVAHLENRITERFDDEYL
jgi:hypothetical protein